MKYHPRNIQNILFLQLMRLQERRSSQGGYSLVVTVAMLLILSTLLISAAVVSKVNTASTTSSAKSNSGFFGAEAGLNIRAKDIRDRFEDYNRPSGVSPNAWDDCADASSANNGSGDFACNTINFQGQDVLTFVEESPANPSSIIIPNGERFEGLSAQEYRYDLVSVAKDNNNLPTAMLEMSFKSRVVPVFQFAVFYENDADFTVPPNMTLNGRVHSNADLYLNTAWNQYTLRINGQVTTGGTLYRGDKAERNSQQCRGTVVIPALDGTDQNLNCTSTTTITAYDNDTTSPSDISTWDGAIQTDITPLELPKPDDGYLNPVDGNLYWDSADLRVVLDTSGGPGNYEIEIRDLDGSVKSGVTSKLNNSCPVLEDTTLTSAATTSQFNGLNVADASEFAGDEEEIFLSINGNSHNKVLKNVSGNTIDLSRQLQEDVPASSTVRRAVVSSSDTFFNYREKHGLTGGTQGQEITMLNVDVQALLDCVHDQDLMEFASGTAKPLDDDTDGGLVWFFTVDDGGTKPDLQASTSQVGSTYGVRLFNGKHLSSTDAGAPKIKGLTIVSDEAVYVQGDYNVNGNDPTTAGITEEWRPASVLSDSVNVLSEAWSLDDSNGRAYVNGLPTTVINFDDAADRRSALETTMNVAFLSGTEITGGDNGAAFQENNINSGGVNNFPRFHEHWGDTNVPAGGQDCDAVYGATQTRHCFNYRGSFVSLEEPRRVNSDFCGSYNLANCNIYTPPVRNWDYDTRFDDAANLPPLTPRAVYLRQELFRRDFDRTSSKTTNLFASLPNIPTIQPNFSL